MGQHLTLDHIKGNKKPLSRNISITKQITSEPELIDTKSKRKIRKNNNRTDNDE
jgi:hypothetical protein